MLIIGFAHTSWDKCWVSVPPCVYRRMGEWEAAIDIQKVLPFGTPDEVKLEAKKTMEILGRGGGYILAPTHYVQADVPPENVVALRDAVLEYGRYPLNSAPY